MPPRDTIAVRPTVVGLVVVLVLAALASAPVAEASSVDGPRAYRISGSASSCLPAGVESEFELRLDNTSNRVQLGSANLTPGFGVAEATARVEPAGLPVPATVVNGTIQLRDLGVAPGESVVVSFRGTPSAAATYVVDAVVKQSNNFSGPPGNDLRRFGEPATFVVPGACALAFVTQPATAVVNEPVPGPGLGTWPQVAVVDAEGEPVDVGGLTVTMSLAANSFGATLSGTSTATTNDEGLATFGDLKVDNAGTGYRLVASADGFQAVHSEPFDVLFAGQREICDPFTQCTGSAVAGGLSATASGTAGSDGGNIFVGVGLAVGDDCTVPEGVVVSRLPAEVTVVANGLGAKDAELRVSKEADQLQPNNGVAFYQVCAQPIEPLQRPADEPQFFDRFTGAPVFAGHWGFLPDCGLGSNVTAAPCVVSRIKNGAEPVITADFGSGWKFR
jgi:hypothetical protein